MKSIMFVAVAFVAVACVSGPRPVPDDSPAAATGVAQEEDCSQYTDFVRENCELKNERVRDKAALKVANDKLAEADKKPAPPAPAPSLSASVVGIEHYDPASLDVVTTTPAAFQADGTVVGSRTFYRPVMTRPGDTSIPGIKFMAMAAAIGYNAAETAVACFERNGNYVPVQDGLPVYLDLERTGRIKPIPYFCAPISATVWWQGVEPGEFVRMVVAVPGDRTLAGHRIFTVAAVRKYDIEQTAPLWEAGYGNGGQDDF